MLQKLSNFIVNKKYFILGLMVLLAIASFFMMLKVEINEDMTKYLPDNSAMKQGMDIMAEEFPEMAMPNTIRVMFDDLTASQKKEMLSRLQSMEYVDSVDYEADSPDYNKDNHTLYIINTSYSYKSEEERSIEKKLDTDFSDYTMVWNNDYTGNPDVPVWILAIAVVIICGILLVMCSSWIEPFLFLIVIGVAIVINMGTNLIQGTISDTTFSIAAILQLVLSMDYSIILINRYRQERELTSDKDLAMKAALKNAFSSVASSSLTTVVGLLMLVFMSFKIGLDLGVVLAKGVFISMVCVLTMLPGIILTFDKIIARTAKKPLHIPMGWAAAFSYKFRHAMGILLLVLFVGAYILQTKTGIVYTVHMEDAVADVFPASNTTVLLYENQDEDKISDLAEKLEKDKNVRSVTGYSTMLAKPYTSEELAKEIAAMGDGMMLNADVLKMLYYDYYTGGETGTMSASELLHFISDTIASDKTFSEYIDPEMLDNMEMIEKFADADTLTRPMTANELANFFGMGASEIKDLFLFYNIENGTMPTNSMTLATYTDFVIHEVATDPDYASMFDSESLSQLKQLETFTNAEKMTSNYNCKGIASLLGMDEDTAKLIFVYYYALSDSYEPGTMTLPEFVTFLQTDVMNNPAFSDYLDESSKEQIATMAQYTDKSTVQARLTPGELASFLGMDETMIRTVFVLHNAPDVSEKTMTLAQFAGFLNDSLIDDPMFRPYFDEETIAQLSTMNGLVQAAESGQVLSSSIIVQLLDLDESIVKVLDYIFSLIGGDPLEKLNISLPDFTSFLVNRVLTNPLLSRFFTEEQAAQLVTLNQMVQLAAAHTDLDTSALAQLFGMEEDMITTVFRLYYGSDITDKTMSLEELIDFILTDPVMSSYLDEESLSQLQMLQSLISATVNESPFTYPELANFLAMDTDMAKMVYTLHASKSEANSWYLTPQTIMNFLVNNSDTFRSAMGDETLSQLAMMSKIINGSVNGTAYNSRELAELMGIDEDQTRQLYLLYMRHHEDTSGWKLSPKNFIDFIISSVLPREDLAGQFDAETAKMLTSAQVLVDAVVSGKKYTSAEMGERISGLTQELDGNMLDLLYLYYSGCKKSDPSWTMTLETLFNFMVSDVLNDPRFDSLIEPDMRETLLSSKIELEDGKAQLVTSKHSRLIITTSYPQESEETTAFFAGLHEYCTNNFDGSYYLIGNSAMSYEMQQTFNKELLFITLLTALAIFTIIALTFKSLSIPLILVLLVQCGVFITVTVTGIMSGSMYYLALLIVECILMGATVDYGILLTNYYCEARKTMPVKEALQVAYEGSNHTILTSGLILILVTAIVGNFFEEPTISAIVSTISIGALCATLLILFILPGVLAVCDKIIIRKKKEKK